MQIKRLRRQVDMVPVKLIQVNTRIDNCPYGGSNQYLVDPVLIYYTQFVGYVSK